MDSITIKLPLKKKRISSDDIYGATEEMCRAISDALFSLHLEKRKGKRKGKGTKKQQLHYLLSLLFPYKHTNSKKKNVWYDTVIDDVYRMRQGTWVRADGTTFVPDILLKVSDGEIYLINFSENKSIDLQSQVNHTFEAYGLPSYGFQYDIGNGDEEEDEENEEKKEEKEEKEIIKNKITLKKFVKCEDSP